ncbi:putative endo-polygalacturonase [Helianthus anomalus]
MLVKYTRIKKYPPAHLLLALPAAATVAKGTHMAAAGTSKNSDSGVPYTLMGPTWTRVPAASDVSPCPADTEALGCNPHVKGCMDNELQSLYLFKKSVFEPSSMLATWTCTSCCLWERVWCDGITENIKSLYLRGRISSHHDFLVINDVDTSFVALKELQYLDLSWNDFQGSLIPQFIGSLKQLQHLNLSTSLSGILPDFIGNLSNIKKLDLSYNFFDGRSPHSFQNLSSLQFLDLSDFDLYLSWNLGNFLNMIPSLLELHLSNSHLVAASLSHRHHNFSMLPKIQYLALSDNDFGNGWDYLHVVKFQNPLEECPT